MSPNAAGVHQEMQKQFMSSVHKRINTDKHYLKTQIRIIATNANTTHMDEWVTNATTNKIRVPTIRNDIYLIALIINLIEV